MYAGLYIPMAKNIDILVETELAHFFVDGIKNEIGTRSKLSIRAKTYQVDLISVDLSSTLVTTQGGQLERILL